MFICVLSLRKLWYVLHSFSGALLRLTEIAIWILFSSTFPGPRITQRPCILLTLPSECVSLSGPVWGDIHPRSSRRGGGNVGIGFTDFQGLWERRKTVPSFSGLSINRHFHGLLLLPPTFTRRSSPQHRSSLDRTRPG
jgi:hypothetical protein